LSIYTITMLSTRVPNQRYVWSLFISTKRKMDDKMGELKKTVSFIDVAVVTV